MTLAIIILLAVWILRLGVVLGRERLANRLLLAQNKALESTNRALRGRVADPDAVLSDIADVETATAFAIRAGYFAALQIRGLNDNADLRADALCRAQDYYLENIAAKIAAGNH
jgi:hypothetical protein